MTQINNVCTVNSTYCQTYDLITNKCLACPQNKILDTTTGQYCVEQIPNCLIVSYNGCGQCKEQYIIDTANNNVCKLFSPIAYQLSPTTATCLQVNFYYDSTQSKCVQTTIVGVNYCKQVSAMNATICSVCIAGHFLGSGGNCESCKDLISNCLLCSSCASPSTCAATCTTCQP